MDDDVNDETKMIDDLCFYEFLRKRFVKLREEYVWEHNADTPEKKGKLLLHINAAFISISISVSSSIISSN